MLGFRFQNNWNFLFFKKEKKKMQCGVCFVVASVLTYTQCIHTQWSFLILPVEASLYTIKIKYLVVFKIVQKNKTQKIN